MTVKSLGLNQQIQKLINIFSAFSSLQLAIITLAANIVNTLLFSLVLFPEDNSGPHFDSTLDKIVLLLIIAPIVETYIFQSWLIKKILAHSNNNKFLALVISAIVFGIGHHYSIAYIFNATIAGFLYSFLFLIISEKKQNPFFYIAAIHATFNFIGFLITS